MILQATGSELSALDFLAGLVSAVLVAGATAFIADWFNQRSYERQQASQQQAYEQQQANQRGIRADDLRKNLRAEIAIGCPTEVIIEEDDDTVRTVSFPDYIEEIKEEDLEEILPILDFSQIPTEFYELHRSDLGLLDDDEHTAVLEYYGRARAFNGMLEPLSLDHYQQLLEALSEINDIESPDFLPTFEARLTMYAGDAFDQLLLVYQSGERAKRVLPVPDEPSGGSAVDSGATDSGSVTDAAQQEDAQQEAHDSASGSDQNPETETEPESSS